MPARFLVACVALAAVAQTTRAQPRGFEPPSPRSVVLNLLDSVGDKALTTELKLTDEQVKKLTGHRQKEWDAAYTSTPAEFARTQAERNKATAALLKDVLTPAQHERATQLMAQAVLQGYGGPISFFDGPAPAAPLSLVRVPASTLRQYPEIAEAAKLTPEQRKVIEAGAGSGGFPGPGGFGGPFGFTEPRVVLAPDQTELLRKFLGPVATVTFRMSFDPRQQSFGGGPGFGGDDALSALSIPAVQTELKISEEQVRTADRLRQTRDRAYFLDLGDLSPEKAAAREKEIVAEAEKGVAELLTKEQAARLKQIQLRLQIGPSPDPLAVYAVPEVAEGIGLSDAQKKALTDAAAAHRAEAVKALEADEPLDVLQKRLAAARAARDAAIDKAVTAGQKAKLKDLLGAEFQDVRYGGNLAEVLKRMRTASFGKYADELSIFTMQAVRADLKLSAEQDKRAAEAITAYRVKFGQGGFPGNQTQKEADRDAEERHAFVAKALEDILTADQRKRFRQLVIQYREQSASSGSGGLGGLAPAIAVGVPGVAEEVQLTAEQKKKLLDGTATAEVLTGDQKAALRKLAGEPMKGEFYQPFAGGRHRPSPRVALLDSGAINPELKLTPEQEYKLALALEEYATRVRESTRRPGGKEPPPDAAKAQEEALAACEKAVDAVLTPEQKKRLAQLELQAAGSLTASFARPDVAAKLAVTPDQQAKLDAVRADYRERNRLASETNPFGGPFGRFDRDSYQSYRAAVNKTRAKARDRMLAVLTETQKAAWKELVGEPSEAIQSGRVLGGRGGLGFGGGPRGIDP